jgi:hypothetical protein
VGGIGLGSSAEILQAHTGWEATGSGNGGDLETVLVKYGSVAQCAHKGKIDDNSSAKKIETYLGTLRTRLRGFGNEEVNDIVEELRSHILEKSTVNGELPAREVDAVIEALGTPQELAIMPRWRGRK